MADRIQLRRDTKANWESYNPILLEGEPGHVLDDPNLYKMGDGVHTWNQLPYRGYNGNILQNVKSGVDNAVPCSDGVAKELTLLGDICFSLGSINSQGAEIVASTRVRSSYIKKGVNTVLYTIDPDIYFIIVEYADSGEVVAYFPWGTQYIIESGTSFRLAAKYKDDRNLTESDFDVIKSKIKIVDAAEYEGHYMEDGVIMANDNTHVTKVFHINKSGNYTFKIDKSTWDCSTVTSTWAFTITKPGNELVMKSKVDVISANGIPKQYNVSLLAGDDVTVLMRGKDGAKLNIELHNFEDRLLPVENEKERAENEEKHLLGSIWTSLDFEQGTISSAGVRQDNDTRIRTKGEKNVKAGESFIIRVGTNQMVLIGVYDLKNVYTPGGWIHSTTIYTASEDCRIVALVAKNDNGNITPDEINCYFYYNNSPYEYFIDKLLTYGSQINTINDVIKGFNLTSSDFEQGGYSSNGEKSANTIRIRTKDKITVLKGQKVNISVSDGQQILIGVFHSDGSYTPGAWGNYNNLFIAEEDCQIVFMVRYANDASITPANYNCTISSKNIETRFLDIEEELYQNTDRIGKCESRLNGFSLTQSDFEQGSYNPQTGEKMSATIRIRTKDKYYLYKGQKVHISIGAGQQALIGIFHSDGSYTPKGWGEFDSIFIAEETCYIIIIVRYLNDATIVPSYLDCSFDVPSVEDRFDVFEGVINRNSDKVGRLVAASNNGREFQLCLTTDPHYDKIRFRNAVLVTEGFPTIKALLGLGDFVKDNPVNQDEREYVINESADIKKIALFVLGNHDVGNDVYIPNTIDNEQAYNVWFAPLHERGILSNTENTPGRCYWYKDLSSYNVRLIGLNCYDEDIQYDETDWRAIEYDSSYINVTINTTYPTGSKVNVPNFTKNSFEAVHEVVTDDHLWGNTYSTAPHYKCKRGTFVIGETQANWLADKLATTPEGYGVVIALHGPFSPNCTNQSNLKFANKAELNEHSDPGSHYMMGTDFLAGIVNAYINRSVYDENVKMAYKTSDPDSGMADYMNTKGSGENRYAYHITKDFTNAKGKFMCWLGGHWHKDIIWKHDTYNQYQITPTWTNEKSWYHESGYQKTDIITSTNDDTANDCLTVVSFDVTNKKIKLVKIGQDFTTLGEHRDYEVLDLD